METNPLICRASKCTGYYMIRTSTMKELKVDFLIVKIFLLGISSTLICYSNPG